MAEDLMLTKEQLVAYKEAFNLFDEDKSGELDVEELGLVIRSIGFEVSEKEVRDLCYEADEDGSGALNFQGMVLLLPLLVDK
jgi:calmodulin